jgi:hypothetical protein
MNTLKMTSIIAATPWITLFPQCAKAHIGLISIRLLVAAVATFWISVVGAETRNMRTVLFIGQCNLLNSVREQKGGRVRGGLYIAQEEFGLDSSVTTSLSPRSYHRAELSH